VHVPAVSPVSPDGPVPVVLLVPGGGWQTADRAGLSPLAGALADAGMLAVNATYRAGQDGATFPGPVLDVACAAGFAVAQAAEAGLDAGPLVLVGHSAGGHLAALVATGGGQAEAGDAGAGADGSGCPHPIPTPDGFIGLAGVYDTASFAFELTDFFGSARAEDRATWDRGDPVARVAAGLAPEGLQVLLMHGAEDSTVPLAQSQALADALGSAGIPVQLDVLAGVTHGTIYAADVAAADMIQWLGQTWPAGSPASASTDQGSSSG
jgi:acetyl esterase/lipase